MLIFFLEIQAPDSLQRSECVSGRFKSVLELFCNAKMLVSIVCIGLCSLHSPSDQCFALEEFLQHGWA